MLRHWPRISTFWFSVTTTFRPLVSLTSCEAQGKFSRVSQIPGRQPQPNFGLGSYRAIDNVVICCQPSHFWIRTTQAVFHCQVNVPKVPKGKQHHNWHMTWQEQARLSRCFRSKAETCPRTTTMITSSRWRGEHCVTPNEERIRQPLTSKYVLEASSPWNKKKL